jgi:hypothetical protein
LLRVDCASLRLARRGADRLRSDAPPKIPPPIVTKGPSEVLYGLALFEPIVLGRKDESQFLSRGNIIGRLVVKMATKVSRVPQAAASSPA